MAWSVPATVVTGGSITASWGNTYVRDNTRYLKGLDGAVTIQDALTATGDLQGSGVLKAGSTPVTLTNAAGKLLALSSTILSDLSGANLTSLNASALGSGTVPAARLSGNNVSTFTNDSGYLTSASGLNASNLSSGTMPNARFPAFPAARAYHNANQTPGATTLYSALNSERFDTDTIHDNVTNNSRLTCKTAGVYLIIGSVYLSSDATGYLNASIQVNRTATIVQQGNYLATPLLAYLVVSAVYQLAVNDYVELYLSTGGGNLTVYSAGNYSPELMMIRLGA